MDLSVSWLGDLKKGQAIPPCLEQPISPGFNGANGRSRSIHRAGERLRGIPGVSDAGELLNESDKYRINVLGTDKSGGHKGALARRGEACLRPEYGSDEKSPSLKMAGAWAFKTQRLGDTTLSRPAQVLACKDSSGGKWRRLHQSPRRR